MLDFDKFEQRAKLLDMSDKDVSVKANISPSIISEWRTGKHEPGLLSMISISRVLGVTVDYFIKED